MKTEMKYNGKQCGMWCNCEIIAETKNQITSTGRFPCLKPANTQTTTPSKGTPNSLETRFQELFSMMPCELREQKAKQCVEIAEQFAVDFMKWFIIQTDISPSLGNRIVFFDVHTHEEYSVLELIEKFKVKI